MARTRVYRYSAESLRRFKWRAVIVGVAIAVVIIGVAAAISLGESEDALALMIVGVMLAVLADGALALVTVDRYRAARDRTAAVSTTAIERREANNARSLSMPFENTRTLAIWRLRSGEVVAVGLRGAQGRPLWFSGFHDMDSMARQMRDAAPPDCEIRERRHLVDWGHPLALAAGLGFAVALALVGWLLANATHGERPFSAYSGALGCGLGLFYLFWRPAAQNSMKRLHWLDLVVGVCWLVSGTIYILLAF